MDDLKISVLVPAYNCSKYIMKCITSILNQSYSNLELLISDDGSSDNTREIIDSVDDKRIKRFHSNENIGKNLICNSLFDHAKGEFVSVHDADDFSHPKRFEYLMKILKINKEYVMCGSSYYSVDEKGVNIIESNKMETSVNKITENIKA